MEHKHNKELVPLAKDLRRNMTREERQLWYQFLKTYPVRFVRQKVVGNFIVDFYCARAKLAVEVDGSQHYEEANMEKDAERTAVLNRYGVRVIRIANNDINGHFFEVCEYLDRVIQETIGRESQK